MPTSTSVTKPRYHRALRGRYTVLLVNGREVTAILGPATLDELVAQYECDQYDREHKIGHYAEEVA